MESLSFTSFRNLVIWGDNRLTSYLFICLLISSQLALMKWKQADNHFKVWSSCSSQVVGLVPEIGCCSVCLLYFSHLCLLKCGIFPRPQSLCPSLGSPGLRVNTKQTNNKQRWASCYNVCMRALFCNRKFNCGLTRFESAPIFSSSPLSTRECSIKFSFHCLRVLFTITLS